MLLGTIVVVVALTLPLAAQTMIGAKAGLLSYTEGEVYLRDKVVESSASQWPRMQDNDWLRTGRGRAELLLNPCVVLHLDRNQFPAHGGKPSVGYPGGFGLGPCRITRRRQYQEHKSSDSGQGLLRDFGSPGSFSPGNGGAGPEGVRRKGASGSRRPRSCRRTGKTIVLGGALLPVTKFDVQKTDPFDYWSRVRMIALARATGGGRRGRGAPTDQAGLGRPNAADAQIHDPGSVFYDPNFPAARPPWPPPPSQPGAMPGRGGGCMGTR